MQAFVATLAQLQTLNSTFSRQDCVYNHSTLNVIYFFSLLQIFRQNEALSSSAFVIPVLQNRMRLILIGQCRNQKHNDAYKSAFVKPFFFTFSLLQLFVCCFQFLFMTRCFINKLLTIPWKHHGLLKKLLQSNRFLHKMIDIIVLRSRGSVTRSELV